MHIGTWLMTAQQYQSGMCDKWKILFFWCVCGLAICQSGRCLFVSNIQLIQFNQSTNCCFSFSCCSQFSLYFLFVSVALVDSWPVALTTANRIPLVIVNSLSLVWFIYYFALFHKMLCIHVFFPPSCLLWSSGPQTVTTVISESPYSTFYSL